MRNRTKTYLRPEVLDVLHDVFDDLLGLHEEDVRVVPRQPHDPGHALDVLLPVGGLHQLEVRGQEVGRFGGGGSEVHAFEGGLEGDLD